MQDPLVRLDADILIPGRGDPLASAALVIAFDVNPIDDIGVWGDLARVTHVWKGGEVFKGQR